MRTEPDESNEVEPAYTPSVQNAQTGVNVPNPAEALGLNATRVSLRETIHEFGLHLGRSIMKWGSPASGEEIFAWRYLAQCKTVLDVACGNGSFIAKRPLGV